MDGTKSHYRVMIHRKKWTSMTTVRVDRCRDGVRVGYAKEEMGLNAARWAAALVVVFDTLASLKEVK